MKKIYLLLAILLTTTIIAENNVSFELSEGKNTITIEDNIPIILASQLSQEYPGIESISTIKYGQTFGYVNTLGGLGKDILIESGKTYEIYVAENITINLN